MNSRTRGGRSLVVVAVSLAGCALFVMAMGLRTVSSRRSDQSLPSVTAQMPITVKAAGRGKPFFNFHDGRRVTVNYRGDGTALQVLQTGEARPRAMASIVLADNGIPDLIAGYAGNGTGIVTVQRGNPDAFAPNDQSVFARMQQGYNPEALLPDADTYAVPETVDFLQVGDFNHDGLKDVLTAARGGSNLFLLAGDGQGHLGATERIPLAGVVTAMSAGEFRIINPWTDIAVALETASGPVLMVFDGVANAEDQPITIPLRAAGTSIAFASMDGDPFQDLVVLAGGEVDIVHGWSRRQPLDALSRVERIGLGSNGYNLAVGLFVWNRAANNQIAVLSDQGVVQVWDRSTSDTRPYSAEESALFSRARMKKTGDSTDVELLPSWQPSDAQHWVTARTVAVSPQLAARAAGQNVLLRGHISAHETDDLLMLDGSQNRVSIVRQNDSQPSDTGVASGKLNSAVGTDSAAGDLATVSLDTSTEPMAIVEMPQKLNGEKNVLMLQSGAAGPVIIPAAANFYRVDFGATPTADCVDSTTHGGSGTSLDPFHMACLRGAVTAANANAGSTIILPAGTYTLTINGTTDDGCDGNNVGDLGINESTTIQGAGSGSTTIQQSGTGPVDANTGDGDRAICLNETIANSKSYTFSGFKIVGGRNTTTYGGAAIIGGGHLNSLSMTDVTVVNNQSTGTGAVSGGGAVQIVGGDLTITNCTFGGTSNPGTFTDRSNTTTGNLMSLSSGGGLSFNPSSAFTDGTVGNLTVTGTTFTRNQAGSISSGGGGVDINNLSFNGHTAGTGTMSFTGCSFNTNQATGAGNTGNGGGLLLSALNATIATTSFTSNSATNKGGGIYNGGGTLTLNGSSPSNTFTTNTAGTTDGGSSLYANSTTILQGTNTTVDSDIVVGTNGSWTSNSGSTISPTNFRTLGGTTTLNNSTMNVSGEFELGHEATKGGILNANSATINIQGNLTVDLNNGGSGATGQFNQGTSTFVMNGSGSQTISNTGTGTPITFNNLTDSNTSQPVSVSNSLNVGGTLNVNGTNAILNPAAAAIIGGSGTLTGTGTTRVTRTNATADFLSQYTITNKTLTSLTVEYIGAAAQVLSATTFGPLKINNGSGVTLSSGTATVNSTLTLTAGALAVGGATTLNINNGSSVSAGSLTSNATGTVVYGQTSAGQSVISANYGNLTFSNFNKVLPAATVGVAGTFTPGSATGHTITGNTFDFNGAGTQSVAAFNYNNLTISGNRGLAQVTLAPSTIGVAGTFSPTATNVVYVKTSNTFDFNGSGTQSVAAFNYNNLTISGARGGATVTLGSGTVGIAGVFNPSATAVSYATTGNTVEYNGTSAQTMPSAFTTYNNLTLNNSAGVTPFANLTVNGLLRVQAGTFTSDSGTYKDVQIDSGTTLAGTNATTINVAGGWTNNGTFTHNSNTLNFNGAAAQLIGGTSATTFNNLTVNNITTVTVSNGGNTVDATVAGLLTLTTDLTVAASAILQQSGTSGGAGDVIGTVRRTDLGLTTRAFGNPFNTITIDSGSGPTQLDATLVKSAPIDFTGAVKRTYTLTPTGGAGFSATLKLHYLDADLNGNTEASLGLWQKSAATWISRGRTGSVDTANNAVTLSGVTSFSDWTLASVPDVSVSVSPSAVKEDGATNLVYTFARTGNVTGALTINFNVTGDATFNTDYTASGADTFTSSAGTVTFAAGNANATVTIDPTTDTDQENNETVILTVVSGGNYNAGSPSAATGTISNDETTTTITSDNPDPSNAGQAVSVNYTVTAPNGTPTGNVLVSDGVDSNTCTVAAGTCSLTLNTTGPRTITATYQGDSNFNSSFDTESHNVCISAVVTTAADSGAGSLRQIITDACDGSTVTFDTAGVFSTPQTITLTTGELAINKNLIIDAPNAAGNHVTISGNNASRVFNINSGKTVTISDLTITGGNSAGSGGGVFNDHGALTLSNVTVNGNTAASGGGVAVDGATSGSASLTVSNSTISSNSSTTSGGGVYVTGIGGAATLIINNSTISANNADLHGGGLFATTATSTLTNVTVTNNRADNNNDNSGSGGGLGIVAGATTTLYNTIVAGNFNEDGVTDARDDINGPLDAAGTNNLIGDGTNMTGISNGSNGNQVGTGVSPIDAMLGALANNGGPTMTHALLFGSPAIEAGTDVTTLNGGIDNVTTSVTLTDATAIPANIGLVIRIDDEQMTVTNKVGNVLTVSRAANGTTAASHLTGAGVNPAFDQRGIGFIRKADSADVNTTQTVDIGAFECQATVEDISDKTTPQDTPLSFSFNVGDAAQISSVAASSSNTTLVPNLPANINVTGAGSTRSLNITPASGQTGTSTITVTVFAGTESMSDTFVLTVSPPADAPNITNATTNEDTQTTSGLVITRGANQGPQFAFFKISNITNGTLFKNDGVTAIGNNQTITEAEGNAGLKFTPAANLFSPGTTFSFQAQGATAADGSGASPAATATITVNPVADAPSITATTTNEDTQSTTGLVISRNAVDGAEITHFKITGITNGTLFQNDGTTAISNGSFITFAQGNAGLKFTPGANLYSSVSTFSFQAQGATNGSGAGLGTAATATITVNPIADTPSVNPNPQTTAISTQSGPMVISRNAADGSEVTHFKITNIQNGTLFQNDGTTAINNNDFITFAQGNAGLKFTPTAGLSTPGNIFGFDVQASLNNTNGGLGGGVVTESILVNACSDPQVVTKTVDDGSAGTLRYAIINSCPGTGSITFNLPAGPQTITLGSSLTISKTLTITGPANQAVTINGGGSRVFDVTGGSPSISNLTITGAVVSGSNGGGLRNSGAGTVSLTAMTFTANSADNGGAVATTAGTINVTNSTISGNTATTDGGGVYVNGGTVTFLNDTVTNNTATAGQGGGLRVVAGTANVRNTIIAGNNAPAFANVSGAITNLGNNLLTGDPKLAALANNGGPTMTHALLAGSPALDAGDNTAAAALTTDQRGNTFGRLRDAASDADTTQTVDIGAFEADPSVEDIADKATAEDTALPSFSFKVGDAFSAFDSITATSSNTALVPNANVTVGADTASTRLLSITPVANQFGTATITVTVAKTINGTPLSMTDTFLLTVTPVADTPLVTNATTNEDTQTTSGLVISRNAADGAEVTHFKITGITGGTLFKNNGTTQINNGDLITFAEGNAGLKFTPTANLFSPATTFGFNVQGATDGAGSGLSPMTAATITVNSVNDVPSFTKGADQTVNENAGAQTVLNWATSLSTGPANEAGQVLSFQVTNNSNPGLFSAAPAVSSAGTLTYTPAANTFGTAAITIVAKDDGGTANGGVDTSAPQTFNLTVSDGGTLQFSAATYTVGEGSGPAVITITRSGGTAGTATVLISTSDGTATAADYTSLTNHLVTFNSGETSKTVNVQITDDLINEPNETINLTLSSPGGSGVLGAQATAVLTINDNDPVGGYLKFSSATYNVSEGGVATITVQRVGTLTQAVTVDFATTDNSTPAAQVSCAPTPGNTLASSRCDFTSTLGRLTFGAGDGADKTFTVLTTQDSYVEGPETLTLTLSNVTGGATLATPSTATLTIDDDVSEPATNPVDVTATFVEQLYRDFLNRESDPAGKAFWVDNIEKCHDPARRLPGIPEAQCIEVQRINTAASFFLSIEFQTTGGTSYLTNRAAFNSRPNFLTFEADAQAIGKGFVFGQPGADAILEANKVAYFNEFVTRTAFTTAYNSLTNAQYVDALIAHTGVSFSSAERNALVNGLDGATETRATVLRKITENDSFEAAEFNVMFVQMEYIGFLRRDADTAGFTFWLNKLNSFNGDYIAAEMIKAFISSDEYRHRFGP